MKRARGIALSVGAVAAMVAAAPLGAQGPQPADPPSPYARAIAAGYKAAMLCSGIFNAGRSEAQIASVELAGIYPEYAPLLPGLAAKVDRATASVTVAFDPALPPRRATWRPYRGCTNYPIGSAPPPVVQRYPLAPAPAAADPRPWPLGDGGIAPRPAPALAGVVGRAFDRRSYGRGRSVGVVVLHDGAVVAERYGEGFGPFTSNRTWSVAKSIAGTLAGMAVQAGAADPAAPARIPEWMNAPIGDTRRTITLDQLLRMASGLHGEHAGARTDAIYFGGTGVGEQATGLPLEVAPGTRFRYANNDILLAVRSLRTTLGEERYRSFPRDALFAPLGMAHTVAETDWQGNYILSSQVWSTARDLARLGQLWLDNGMWQGRRLLPENWVAYLTAPSGPQPASGPGYGATMWLFGPKQGLPAGSYAAQGNRGQYVMVIPSRRLVVVRRGEDGGSDRFDIARFAADVAGALR